MMIYKERKKKKEKRNIRNKNSYIKIVKGKYK